MEQEAAFPDASVTVTTTDVLPRTAGEDAAGTWDKVTREQSKEGRSNEGTDAEQAGEANKN